MQQYLAYEVEHKPVKNKIRSQSTLCSHACNVPMSMQLFTIKNLKKNGHEV